MIRLISLWLLGLLFLTTYVSAMQNYTRNNYGAECYGVSTCTSGQSNSTTSGPTAGSEGDGGGGGGNITRSGPNNNSSNSSIPFNLLDITFNLEQLIITRPDTPKMLLTFQSFGTDPISLLLTYHITNEAHEEVYLANDTITIFTDQVFQETVPVDLPVGNYWINVSAEYAGVTEQFGTEFEIRDKSPLLSPGTFTGLAIALPVVLLLLALLKQHVVGYLFPLWGKHSIFGYNRPDSNTNQQ
jgi:hypothetical protein